MVLLSDKHPIDLTIGQELPPTFHYAWVILPGPIACRQLGPVCQPCAGPRRLSGPFLALGRAEKFTSQRPVRTCTYLIVSIIPLPAEVAR